jgi:hypothetical protein
MNVRRYSYTLILTVTAYLLPAQFTNVLISTLNSPEEVCIAINPKNTGQLVAGSNITNAYHSSDGGNTWIHQDLACDSFNVWGDPVVIWDTMQACYFLHLSNPSPTVTGGSWIDRIVIQRSTDFGATYTTCRATGKNGSKAQDKPWAVVNPFNNELHVTWTQFDNYGSSSSSDSSIILHSKSSDQGITWSSPKRISFYAGDCLDGDNTVEGAVPAIGPAGEVYVAWAGPKGLTFQKSTDGGNTWLPKEKIIRTITGGWDYNINGLQRCNGLPFTYCDLSKGPYRGTIYINYSDHKSGFSDGDIWMIRSSDNGVTWSQPVRVNNDVPGKEQFMSAMTVDQVTGNVYVIFYDRRNFATGTNTDVYMALSKDGGKTFYNYKINDTTFNPNSGVFFGDYIGISAHNNVIRPIWTQLTNTVLSVYTAIVNPVILGIYDAAIPALELREAFPNPFKTSTEISFSLTKAVPLTIQLLDNEGRVIAEYAQTKVFHPGNHKIKINDKTSLSPGTYFIVIYGDERSRFIKLLKE